MYIIREFRINGDKYGPFNTANEARKAALMLARKKNVDVAIYKDGSEYGRVSKGWNPKTHPYKPYLTANGADTIALYMPYFERMSKGEEMWICDVKDNGSLDNRKFKVTGSGYVPMTKSAQVRLSKGVMIYEQNIDNHKKMYRK